MRACPCTTKPKRFVLYADKSRLIVRQWEPITSGSVNVYTVQFQFNCDWEGMTRTAVFKAGAESRSVLLDETNTCSIPWEVLVKHGVQLDVGVCGVRGGETVLPTIWASLGTILEGAATGGEARPPTPDLWQQELASKGDALGYTEAGELGLYAGDRLLSAVPVAGGGEGGSAYTFGHGLKVTGTTVSVNTANDFTGDNTLPIAAAAVETVVGNIEILLNTI